MYLRPYKSGLHLKYAWAVLDIGRDPYPERKCSVHPMSRFVIVPSLIHSSFIHCKWLRYVFHMLDIHIPIYTALFICISRPALTNPLNFG
jgi:hypothetical protein